MQPTKQVNFVEICKTEIAEQENVPQSDIVIVSYVWTLGNLKAVFAILSKDENDLIEATYNTNKDEIYLVTYKQTKKVVI